MSLPVRAVLYDSQADPRHDGGVVIVAVHGRNATTLDAWLDHRLHLARENPAALARIIEAECLAGMADLNREAGAEHSKRTGRRAGGGSLTKGS